MMTTISPRRTIIVRLCVATAMLASRPAHKAATGNRLKGNRGESVSLMGPPVARRRSRRRLGLCGGPAGAGRAIRGRQGRGTEKIPRRDAGDKKKRLEPPHR